MHLVMMIMEKSGDISILKTMGARDEMIERIFAIEGTLIGLVGTVLGVIAGVSVTGQIASGANLIVFTTGRGSVSGYKPTPCIKLATNSEMYARMAEDMDINCGDIITEGVSLEDKGREIFELFLNPGLLAQSCRVDEFDVASLK